MQHQCSSSPMQQSRLVYRAHRSSDPQRTTCFSAWTGRFGSLACQNKREGKKWICKIVCFGDICSNIPKLLKILPVAMIPHKSRAFHTILICPSACSMKESWWNFKLCYSVVSTSRGNDSAWKLHAMHGFHAATTSLTNHFILPSWISRMDSGIWISRMGSGIWWLAMLRLGTFAICYPPVSHPLIWMMPSWWCHTAFTRDGVNHLPSFVQPLRGHKVILRPWSKKHLCPCSLCEGIMIQDISTDLELQLKAAASNMNLVQIFVDDFIAAINNLDPTHLENFS